MCERERGFRSGLSADDYVNESPHNDRKVSYRSMIKYFVRLCFSTCDMCVRTCHIYSNGVVTVMMADHTHAHTNTHRPDMIAFPSL